MIFENLDKKFIKSYIRLYKGKKSNLLKISKDIKKIYYMYNEIVRFNLKYANYIQIIGFSIHPFIFHLQIRKIMKYLRLLCPFQEMIFK